MCFPTDNPQRLYVNLPKGDDIVRPPYRYGDRTRNEYGALI